MLILSEEHVPQCSEHRQNTALEANLTYLLRELYTILHVPEELVDPKQRLLLASAKSHRALPLRRRRLVLSSRSVQHLLPMAAGAIIPLKSALANDSSLDVAAGWGEFGAGHLDIHRRKRAHEPFLGDVQRPLTKQRVIQQRRWRKDGRISSSAVGEICCCAKLIKCTAPRTGNVVVRVLAVPHAAGADVAAAEVAVPDRLPDGDAAVALLALPVVTEREAHSKRMACQRCDEI